MILTVQHGPFRFRRERDRITIEAPPERLNQVETEVQRLLRPPLGLEATLALFQPGHAYTSAQVAARLRIRVQNASNKLAALCRSGFLARRECIAETGGIEYEYWLPEGGVNCTVCGASIEGLVWSRRECPCPLCAACFWELLPCPCEKENDDERCSGIRPKTAHDGPEGP